MAARTTCMALAACVLALGVSGCEKGSADPTPAPHAEPAGSLAPQTSASPPVQVDEPKKREPMNVLLLVVDAMRHDMPWQGYPRDIAPNLTRLAKRSVMYERGYSISSYTSKSVGGLISGRYPSELKRTSPFFTKYHDDNVMLAEVLQSAGVRTLGVQAHMYLDHPSGFSQGFDVWEIVPGISFDYNKDPHITSPKHTKLAIDVLSKPENTSGMWFSYLHYMDPHHVYNSHPEAPDFGGTARGRYDQEIWFADKWIQTLLDHIDRQAFGKNTAIIVTSDHGEAFGERGFYRHAFELYEILVRVPLFVYIPGVEPRAIPRWRGHIDLAPTVLDLMGVEKPAEMRGTSLVPEILGEDVAQRPIIADLPADTYNVKHRVLIDDGWKLVVLGKNKKFELYNVKDDPEESKDLFAKEPERAQAMMKRLAELEKDIHDQPSTGGKVMDY